MTTSALLKSLSRFIRSYGGPLLDLAHDLLAQVSMTPVTRATAADMDPSGKLVQIGTLA